MRKDVKRYFSALTSVFAFALLLLTTFSARAQNALDAYAITNARITTVSGAVIERGTIVIRGGLIESVGANVRVPADVRTIDGNGLTVFPGFFDGSTNLGIAAPQRATPPAGLNLPGAAAVAPNATNSNYPQGLQPETTAAAEIRPTDSALETARNFGITTALSVPRERIINGQSALINTAGDSASNLIIKTPVALHISFTTLTGGGFPNSLMGTFAMLRQMFLDAQRQQKSQEAYAKNPRGMRRPDNDKSLDVLVNALNGTIPVVMNANSEREIVRALDLAKEFNLRPIIAGGAESAKVLDRLKAQKATVLLSLNFPKRTTAANPEADPEPLEVLRSRVEMPKTAARLKQAGIPFTFQSGGLTSWNDFLSNAVKTTENGLSREDAVRAMTLNAAEIFGVADRLGSIEPGKIANLTVVRGDFFGKDRFISHVFVDGRLYEQKAPSPPRPPSPAPNAAPNSNVPRPNSQVQNPENPNPNNPSNPSNQPIPQPTQAPAASPANAPAKVPTDAVNIAGNWTLNFDIPNQPVSGTANFTQEGNRLSGTITTPFGSTPIENGEITGDTIRFTVRPTLGGQTLDISFSGKVSGSQMSGMIDTQQGAVNFTGSKNP